MIKLMKHYVTDGKIKAKVFYSAAILINDTRRCVTIYAKDYSDDLQKIFGNEYQNDTDMMTDYFEKGKVRIFESNKLFDSALSRCSYIPNNF